MAADSAGMASEAINATITVYCRKYKQLYCDARERSWPGRYRPTFLSVDFLTFKK